MDNAGVRWKHGQTVERLLGPFQKPIPLAVALELAPEIDRFGVGRCRDIGLEGMVDHEGHRYRGVAGDATRELERRLLTTGALEAKYGATGTVPRVDA